MYIERKVRYENELDCNFLHDIQELADCNSIINCIQCGTCSSSCPMSVYMDITPRRIMAMVKDGFKDDVLNSFTIWLCSSCYYCTVRCPQDIKITDVMYALKRVAISENRAPRALPIPRLAKTFADIVQKYGRNSESKVIMNLWLFKNPFKLLSYIPVGLKLFKKKRMEFKTQSIRSKNQVRKIYKSLARG